MFGMPSKDFWESDPQLYWAYRIFYLKKIEIESQQNIEYMKMGSWLNGNMNYTATSVSLNNAFSKQKKNFPKFEECFGKDKKKEKKKTKEEVDKLVQDEYSAWARY